MNLHVLRVPLLLQRSGTESASVGDVYWPARCNCSVKKNINGLKLIFIFDCMMKNKSIQIIKVICPWNLILVFCTR